MLKHSFTVTALLCVSYGTVFVFGVFGNSIVLLAFIKIPSLRTTTNIFISNMAFADLLITGVSVPFTLASNLLSEWPFGNIVCKLVAYKQAVAVNASINSLMAISIYRCLSIYKPLNFDSRKRMIVVSLILIWLFPIIFMIPWLSVFSVKSIHDNTICADFWESKEASDAYFITINLFISYICPLLIITICYVIMYQKIRSRIIPGEIHPSHRRIIYNKSKIKVIKMIFIVIVSFAISWLPLYVLYLIVKFSDSSYIATKLEKLKFLIIFSQWLATSNACTNPVIYTCYSKKFRNGLKILFKNMFHVKKRQSS